MQCVWPPLGQEREEEAVAERYRSIVGGSQRRPHGQISLDISGGGQPYDLLGTWEIHGPVELPVCGGHHHFSYATMATALSRYILLFSVWALTEQRSTLSTRAQVRFRPEWRMFSLIPSRQLIPFNNPSNDLHGLTLPRLCSNGYSFFFVGYVVFLLFLCCIR
jgi:hypothetical protein